MIICVEIWIRHKIQQTGPLPSLHGVPPRVEQWPCCVVTIICHLALAVSKTGRCDFRPPLVNTPTSAGDWQWLAAHGFLILLRILAALSILPRILVYIPFCWVDIACWIKGNLPEVSGVARWAIRQLILHIELSLQLKSRCISEYQCHLRYASLTAEWLNDIIHKLIYRRDMRLRRLSEKLTYQVVHLAFSPTWIKLNSGRDDNLTLRQGPEGG